MTRPPRSSTLGPPPLSDLTDDEPIVIHGPVQGSTIAGRQGEAGVIRLVTASDVAAPAPPDRVHGGEPFVETPTVPEPAAPPTRQVRAHSLDALRGLFLVVITLSFTIYGSYFPDWMYHRQFPPPFRFVDVAGLTWRDLAYAAFLFTMAAALPLTLTRRIEQGETEISTILSIGRRFVLLFTFALLIGHSNTYFAGYTQTNRLLAVLGFVVMFALFVRRRSDWDERQFAIFRRVAWVAAMAFLVFAPQLYGSTFSPQRKDDIMAALAFASLSGSLVWYFTRRNLPLRLVILTGVAVLVFASRQPGWVHDWWWSSPVPWLMRPSSLILLSVVIPGTIAGDLLLSWMRSAASDAAEGPDWGQTQATAIVAVCIALVVTTVVGLDNRWVLQTTQVVFALCAVGLLLTRSPAAPAEVLVRRLFMWATLWLAIGVLLDPAEGGIRKVPENLSYFVTVAGITTMLLTSIVVAFDILKRSTWSRPLIAVGVNPMLAYVVYSMFLNSILELIPAVRPMLRASAGEAMLRSLLTVVAVVLIVQAFTRRRIYWRT